MPKKRTDELESLPGIGKSLAKDIRDLGISFVPDLIGKDPERLYAQLCTLRGTPVDRCVLYTFRCAVYAASTKNPDKEKLLWWNWKD